MLVVAPAPFIVVSVVPLLAACLGLIRSPLWVLSSVMNAAARGGDAAVFLAFSRQLPINATVRNKGWATWWQVPEPADAPGAAARSVSRDGPSSPANDSQR
jgi:hypothetical protein